jgi:Fe2+ or Zn2+ uptake regulation protein
MEGNNVKKSTAYRALRVQEIYLQHHEPGIPTIYIYRKYIEPEFKISIRTFYRYLNRNARREVRQIENHETSTANT